MISVLIFGFLWSQNPDDKEIGYSNVLERTSTSSWLFWIIFCQCNVLNVWIIVFVFRETDGDMFCRANGTDNGNYERSGVFNLWDESNIHNTNDNLMSKTISSHLLVLPFLYFITDWRWHGNINISSHNIGHWIHKGKVNLC